MFKRIMGFVYLTFFIGFMVYKFKDNIAGQQDGILIAALAVVILLILLLAIRRILVE